jgi:hypothetical protein
MLTRLSRDLLISKGKVQLARGQIRHESTAVKFDRSSSHGGPAAALYHFNPVLVALHLVYLLDCESVIADLAPFTVPPISAAMLPFLD